MFRNVSVAVLLTVFLISSAHAYRTALVASEQVELKNSANPSSSTKSTLPQKTEVNTSDYPTHGYYWIHTKTQSGWVRESDLSFTSPPMASGVAPLHGFDLLLFRINEVTALQSGGSSSFSGEMSWNPSFQFGRRFSVLGNFGVSEFKNQYGSDILILEYQALASLTFGKLSLEVGAGEQRWNNTGNNYLTLSANVLYRLDRPVLRVLDRLYFGYSSVSIPNFPTQEFKMGVELDLRK